jgi:membrane-bound ClpP family serine protease
MTGRVVGPLNPTGFVIIGEKQIPAQSEARWLDDGTQVIVVAEQPFGVTVRPI